MALSPRHYAHSTRAAFIGRVLRYAVFAAGLFFFSFGIGILGYRFFARLDWVDAVFNAAMILTGMGPVDPMPDDAAKLFASFYAIYGGAVYPVVAALVLYPLLHRMLTLLHLNSLAARIEDEGK